MADIIADAIQAVDVDEEKKNAAGKVGGEAEEKRVDAEGKDDYEMGLMSAGYPLQGTLSTMAAFLSKGIQS